MAPWDSGVTLRRFGPIRARWLISARCRIGARMIRQSCAKSRKRKAFQQGMPIDPATGQTDAKAVGAMALKYGDFPLLERMMPFIQQQDATGSTVR